MASELSPRMEAPQPPWTTCAIARFPHREAVFPVVWTEPTVLGTSAECLGLLVRSFLELLSIS